MYPTRSVLSSATIVLAYSKVLEIGIDRQLNHTLKSLLEARAYFAKNSLTIAFQAPKIGLFASNKEKTISRLLQAACDAFESKTQSLFIHHPIYEKTEVRSFVIHKKKRTLYFLSREIGFFGLIALL